MKKIDQVDQIFSEGEEELKKEEARLFDLFLKFLKLKTKDTLLNLRFKNVKPLEKK